MRKIIRNAVKCNHCRNVIESKDRHGFQACPCGRVWIDGGYDYLRRGAMHGEEDYTEMAEFEEEDDV